MTQFAEPTADQEDRIPSEPKNKANRAARRRERRRVDKEAGIIGEIQKITSRASGQNKTVPQIIHALKSLIDRHSQGTEPPQHQPLRRPRANPGPPRPTVPKTPAASADAINKQARARDKGKGRGAIQTPAPSDPLVRLEATHWHGQVVSEDALPSTIANATGGACITCGVVTSRLHDLNALPTSVSVALVSTEPLGTDSVEVRAPARSKAGVLKISKLYVTSKGPYQGSWLQWGPQRSSVSIAKPPESSILRVQVFKAYVDKQDWAKFRSKQGVTDHFRSKIRHAAGQAFVDVFSPKILAEGTDHECISALLRVKQSAAAEVLASSGLAHVYLKPLESSPAGSIKWLKPVSEESPIDFATRVRQQAEGAAVCRGVAFSSTGSLGLRLDPNSQARQWRIVGMRFSTSHDQVLKFLRDHGWSVEWCEQFRAGQKPTWVARAIPPSRDEVFSFLAQCGEDHLHIEISPWAPRPRRAVQARSLGDAKTSFRPVGHPAW